MKELEGVYLVVDPMMDQATLNSKLPEIVRAGVAAIQIWDHWSPGQDQQAFIRQIRQIATAIPILTNNDPELAYATGVAGVHFDRLDDLPDVLPDLITGLTLSGKANWKELKQRGVDYISFCSMFPSDSTDACELVDVAVVREACEHFPGSVFAAGGINLGNVGQIAGLGVAGVALISGLLKSEDPYLDTLAFHQKLMRK